MSASPRVPDERERAQEVPVGEVLAGRDELALVGCTALVVEPPPGRIDLQERVLDEVADGHQQTMIGDRNPVARTG